MIKKEKEEKDKIQGEGKNGKEKSRLLFDKNLY